MQWPDLAAAEVSVSAGLGRRVRLCGATRPLGLTRLSAAERRQAPQGRRRLDWLLGRTALKLLLDGADTSSLAFPHPRVALTHAGGLAVAAGCDGDQDGLGVDFEGWRATDPRMARFFLHDREQRTGQVSAHDLLRLWTVKEALYKATAANAGGGLLDYQLEDPGASVGRASGQHGGVFRYVSGWLPQGPLAVALAVTEGGSGAPV